MADGITRGTTPSITVTVPMNLEGYTCYHKHDVQPEPESE